tara:strand:+ start:121 stop:591 length:471 start_codon:yes stop_codon:yes gene_type:complete
MKITKQQLKQIIKEELEATLDESGSGYFDPNRPDGEGYPFGTPFPGIRGTIKDLGNDKDPKYVAAWKAVGKELRTNQDVVNFIRAVEMPNAEPDAPLTPDAKDVALKLLISMDNNKLKTVYSLKDVVSLMGPEGQRKGHTIGSDHDPGYVRENTKE